MRATGRAPSSWRSPTRPSPHGVLTGLRDVTAGDVASIGDRKLGEIDAQIADLKRMRNALADVLTTAVIDPETPCPVIAALAHA